MGLSNSKGFINYLRIRDGLFVLIKKDQDDVAYDTLSGIISNMYFKDEEYEGTPIRKLIVNVSSDDSVYQFGVNVESQNYTSLVSFLKDVDFSKSISFHPKSSVVKSEGKADRKSNSILVSQGGKFSKSYFTKDHPNGLPEWKKVKVGNKVIIDKSDALEFLEQFVKENYIPNVASVPQTEVHEKSTPVNSSATETESTGFPWDD